MKKVEVLFKERKARLVIEKGKFDEAATRKALEEHGFGGGHRVP